MTALLVALGGALGAVLRYSITAAIQGNAAAGTFPWGTFAVNVGGCFFMGIVSALTERQAFVTADTRAFIAVGVLGGFTTFSAFANETANAVQGGAPQVAAMNVVASVGLCLAAVWLGRLAAGIVAR